MTLLELRNQVRPGLLLATCLLCSWPARAELPGAGLSARHLRLEAARTYQEASRAYKQDCRRERLESKRARLQEALARARDQVQFLTLTAAKSSPAGSGSPPSFRAGLIGVAGLCLLASDPEALCQATEILPPSRVVVAQFEGYPGSGAGTAGSGPDPISGLPRTLTELLMARLASDELDPTRPALQRALQAQRSMLENALGAAIGFGPPAPATPGAQLIQGAFDTALSETAQDVLNDLLPPGFGPLPGRREPPPQAEPGDSEALTQARADLAAARKEVAAAVREAKGVGSDIVVAATSLLGYGAFASVAYGLDIGASITGIFTATPVTGAGVATGTLSAVANEFFLMAYASDAIAGAVTIHKLKEPYIDALLRVSDAEAAWVKALTAYTELRDRPQASMATATGTATGTPPATPTGGSDTGRPEPAFSSTLAAAPGAGPAAAVAATAEPMVPRESLAPDGQTSAATRNAGPFWAGW